MKGKITEYVGAVLFILLCWELLARIAHNPALPGPIPALEHFYRAWYQSLDYHLFVSAYRVVVSIVLALILGMPLGLFLGREPSWDRFLAPVVYLIYPVPKIVFLPLLMLLLGIGEMPKITLIVLIIFFQILITTRDAARSISQQSILSVLSLGAGPAQVYRHVIIPSCLPSILTATRISLGTAIAVLFFTETLAGASGLGYFILDGWHRAEFSDMFAGILAMGLLGVVLYGILDILDRLWCNWQRL